MDPCVPVALTSSQSIRSACDPNAVTVSGVEGRGRGAIDMRVRMDRCFDRCFPPRWAMSEW